MSSKIVRKPIRGGPDGAGPSAIGHRYEKARRSPLVAALPRREISELGSDRSKIIKSGHSQIDQPTRCATDRRVPASKERSPRLTVSSAVLTDPCQRFQGLRDSHS